MAKQIKKTTKKGELPDFVAKALYSEYGSNVNKNIAIEFELTIGQVAKMTMLVADLYNKKFPIDQIDKLIGDELGLEGKRAKQLSIELLGKRFLLVDEKWFNGEALNKFKSLGGKIKQYVDDINKHIEGVLAEQAMHDTAKSFVQRDLAEMKKKAYDDAEEEIEEEERTPEQERHSANNVMKSMVLQVFESKSYDLKIRINIRITTLLLEDKERKEIHKELVEALYHNQEKITKADLVINGKSVDPTIDNWLSDFVGVVGAEANVSSIKKAEYFTNSKNMQKVTPEERKLLDQLFRLYGALKNFYHDLERKDLGDIYIFPFTEEEQKAFVDDMQAEVDAQAKQNPQAKASGDGKAAAPVDIMSLYADKPSDRKKIDEAKKTFAEETRKEYDKIADKLEMELLNRKKHNILACLELLAEIGAMDNVLARDQRYQKYLTGYFKRNNLQGEGVEFKKNPYQMKYIQMFLKFVLLERLGIDQTEGARIAANISNIFMANGVSAYGQLAYLDLSDNKFKWT
jgi:hypothetical protein